MKPDQKLKTKPVRARRTQAERSDAMRERLLAATLQSLAEDGYAGSTLSSIVRRAGVSRGAQVHHYPNKQALFLDTAEDVVRHTYRRLGALLLSIADEDNRLQALVEAAWEQVFATPLFSAYAELLVASQRDADLAKAIGRLLPRVLKVFETAVDHYFERVPGTRVDLRALFLQLGCLLFGLASQARLTHDRSQVQIQLRLWVHQANRVMRARKGVKTVPPRPQSWDRQPVAAARRR